MKSNGLRWLAVLAGGALLLAAVILWPDFQAENSGITAPVAQRHKRAAPSLLVRNVRIVEYDDQGVQTSTLHATKVEQFAGKDTTFVEQPVFHSHQTQTSSPLHVRADRGRILPGGDTIELEDKVVITQPDPESTGERQLTTDFVTLDTEQALAWTDNQVHLVSATDKVTAEGMRFFYRQNRLQLSGQVQAVHAPR